MEFSASDQYLLAVTKDRQVLLFKRDSPQDCTFSLAERVKEAHTRVIWALSWSHDDLLFATSSRENKRSVKIWNGPSPSEALCSLHSELPSGSVPSATAVQFFPSQVCGGKYALIVGQESGALTVWVMVGEWQMVH